jgi:hypothetical protein
MKSGMTSCVAQCLRLPSTIVGRAWHSRSCSCCQATCTSLALASTRLTELTIASFSFLHLVSSELDYRLLQIHTAYIRILAELRALDSFTKLGGTAARQIHEHGSRTKTNFLARKGFLLSVLQSIQADFALRDLHFGLPWNC